MPGLSFFITWMKKAGDEDVIFSTDLIQLLLSSMKGKAFLNERISSACDVALPCFRLDT